MHMRDVFKRQKTTFSFEFFPPKSEKGAESLFRTIAELEKLEPTFVSVTSGAGGVLPRGLTVGVISKLTEKEAIVELSADYARTRLVRIIDYDFPQVDEATPEPVDESVSAPTTEDAAPPRAATAPAAQAAATPPPADPDEGD